MSRTRAWAVMGAVFLGSLAVTANRFKVPPVMRALMSDLGVDMVGGGWLMSVFAVAGIVLAIPAAFLLARWGFRGAGLIALGFTLAGAVLGALSPSAPWMLASRLIEGVGAGLIGVAAPATISAWFGPGERGLPLGIWTTWVPLGNVIMFNVAHPLEAAFGWRAVWWFGVGFAAIALAAYALVVSAPPDRVDAATPRTLQDRAASIPWGQGLRNLPAWILALAFGALAFCLLGYNTWAPTFLTEVLAIPAATASFYASLLFLVGIPGNVIAGWVINRARRRYLPLVGAFVISGLLYAWSFRLGREVVVAPYMATLGFLSNFIPTAIFALAPETMTRPDLAGLSLAIMSVGSNAGVLLGPPVLGAVVDGAGWTTGSLVLVIVMAFGTIASMLTWRMTER